MGEVSKKAAVDAYYLASAHQMCDVVVCGRVCVRRGEDVHEESTPRTMLLPSWGHLVQECVGVCGRRSRMGVCAAPVSMAVVVWLDLAMRSKGAAEQHHTQWAGGARTPPPLAPLCNAGQRGALGCEGVWVCAGVL